MRWSCGATRCRGLQRQSRKRHQPMKFGGMKSSTRLIGSSMLPQAKARADGLTWPRPLSCGAAPPPCQSRCQWLNAQIAAMKERWCKRSRLGRWRRERPYEPRRLGNPGRVPIQRQHERGRRPGLQGPGAAQVARTSHAGSVIPHCRRAGPVNRALSTFTPDAQC